MIYNKANISSRRGLRGPELYDFTRLGRRAICPVPPQARNLPTDIVSLPDRSSISIYSIPICLKSALITVSVKHVYLNVQMPTILDRII